MLDEASHEAARRRMLGDIEIDARDTAAFTGRPEFSDRVMGAMARVPRHRFVPAADQRAAYVNRPLPIGHGQTISQPYIVALMTELLDLAPEDRVLEIGTGCGYQTAVLAKLAAEVLSVERVPELAETARRTLQDLEIDNVRLRTGDGKAGWPEEAPFDAVMVTAAPERIPIDLVEQLAEGGRLVIPIGRRWETQWLLRGHKDSRGQFSSHKMLPVAFVPLL